jgi:ubiquinone biosynthesis monooxygenase Coq7
MTGMHGPLGPTGLPGDPRGKDLVDRILRVDHAGEYGARRIYEGQLAVLGKSAGAPTLKEMAAQEGQHLRAFERLLVERKTRPTALLPLWHLTGYAMGAATALLGESAAMACTVAVEEVIDEHYRSQIAALQAEEPALVETLERFRKDEVAHRDTALAAGAENAPGYEALTAAVKTASRVAIWLSERI